MIDINLENDLSEIFYRDEYITILSAPALEYTKYFRVEFNDKPYGIIRLNMKRAEYIESPFKLPSQMIDHIIKALSTASMCAPSYIAPDLYKTKKKHTVWEDLNYFSDIAVQKEITEILPIPDYTKLYTDLPFLWSKPYIIYQDDNKSVYVPAKLIGSPCIYWRDNTTNEVIEIFIKDDPSYGLSSRYLSIDEINELKRILVDKPYGEYTNWQRVIFLSNKSCTVLEDLIDNNSPLPDFDKLK